jgi:hypothetical protein
MAYSQETQELTIASWNINGKGPSSERQKVLNHYLKKIKNKEDNFTPDIVFLQEVPWIGGGSITGPMLKGTCYSYTADSWVKEEGGPYNAVLHNETRMTAYNGGQIPIEFYRQLRKCQQLSNVNLSLSPHRANLLSTQRTPQLVFNPNRDRCPRCTNIPDQPPPHRLDQEQVLCSHPHKDRREGIELQHITGMVQRMGLCTNQQYYCQCKLLVQSTTTYRLYPGNHWHSREYMDIRHPHKR